MQINVHSNLKDIQRKLSAFAQKQVPFATAQALTDLANQVQKAEQANLPKKLDRPTPFTVGAIKVRRASKSNPRATVYMMDRTAAYLEPYEFGGLNKLNSLALLKPVDAVLNQYGNLARNQLAKYKGRKDVFVGPVNTNAGVIKGVWQRPYYRKAGAIRGQSRKKGRIDKLANTTGHLILLIKFEGAHEARQRIGYRALADLVVRRNFNKTFGAALARAMVSAL